MKMTFLVWAGAVLSLNSSHAKEVTSAIEQKELVEVLSGVTSTGAAGLSDLISQRFSDSVEIQTTANYLKAKYVAAGIDASIAQYNPLDVFPHYFRGIDETYRTYLKHLEPVFEEDYRMLCDGTISQKRKEEVLKRLKRIMIDEAELCAVEPAKRVEHYIAKTVLYTTNVTKKMLQERKLASWPNVVAILKTKGEGETGEKPLCVLGAHMDSVARAGGGRGPIISPDTLAPGADDNATGTAAVYTIARAYGQLSEDEKAPMPCDLAFVHFSGEEEGLLGSLAFVHLQNKRPIRWMINFDMIGYNSGFTDGREGVLNIGYSKAFAKDWFEALRSPSPKLPVVTVEKETFIYSSDQISFWQVGVPAIAISEQACESESCKEPYKSFNPFLHTPDDVSSRLDFDYAARIINHVFNGTFRALTGKSL